MPDTLGIPDCLFRVIGSQLERRGVTGFNGIDIEIGTCFF